jgi:glucokinase
MEPLVLGVDIGGTKVAAGLVNSAGKVMVRAAAPMRVSGSAEDAMDCVHGVIQAILKGNADREVSAIGVASPGPLVLPEGVVLHTPNLPCWKDFPLGDNVRRKYGLPTFIDNDANAAGLAESTWGSGRGYKSVFYVTLGTGIGTAIINDGHVFYGRSGAAPEAGHMSIDMHGDEVCACGKRGCTEGLASGTGIARRARLLLLQHAERDAILADWGTDVASISARTVVEASRKGEPVATGIIRETVEILTIWLGNVIDLIDPDVIVFGGGLSGMASEWFDYIREKLRTCSIIPDCSAIPLRVAAYGSDVGIAGAAALCFRASPVSADSLRANAR